uniref:Uncharacterized protein n=1 Tax=Leersia perrieri TaxID=77586 RepID=A0A0D9WQ24_9ORYZ
MAVMRRFDGIHPSPTHGGPRSCAVRHRGSGSSNFCQRRHLPPLRRWLAERHASVRLPPPATTSIRAADVASIRAIRVAAASSPSPLSTVAAASSTSTPLRPCRRLILLLRLSPPSSPPPPPPTLSAVAAVSSSTSSPFAPARHSPRSVSSSVHASHLLPPFFVVNAPPRRRRGSALTTLRPDTAFAKPRRRLTPRDPHLPGSYASGIHCGHRCTTSSSRCRAATCSCDASPAHMMEWPTYLTGEGGVSISVAFPRGHSSIHRLPSLLTSSASLLPYWPLAKLIGQKDDSDEAIFLSSTFLPGGRGIVQPQGVALGRR